MAKIKRTQTGYSVMLFRHDLRLTDNLAWAAACEHGRVLPLFCFDSEADGAWLGKASQWWLHQSLQQLASQLAEHQLELVKYPGQLSSWLQQLEAANALLPEAVYWNRSYYPQEKASMAAAIGGLDARGVPWQAFAGNILAEREHLLKADGEPYRVYTPFWRKFLKVGFSPGALMTAPKPPPLAESVVRIGGVSLESMGLLPQIPWDQGFYRHWQPGEASAHTRLRDFLAESVTSYHDQRDLPGQTGTSRLSPHLRFGELHPSRVIHEICRQFGPLDTISDPGIVQFAKEIVWREFAYHLLMSFPTIGEQPMDKKFAKFPWVLREDWLEAWQRGQTGYPLVDAGMRELWTTGWMHNRIRMVTGSFLVKHLNIPWQWGERWFFDCLLDADPASNSAGWQWVAGCGADGAPYFRVFNPITQGEKFAADGDYIRKWVPELAKLSGKYVHKPWEWTGPKNGIGNYPAPIVDHQEARKTALDNYQILKSMGGVSG